MDEIGRQQQRLSNLAAGLRRTTALLDEHAKRRQLGVTSKLADKLTDQWRQYVDEIEQAIGQLDEAIQRAGIATSSINDSR